MKDIIPKLMKDVVAPQSNIVRRPNTTPEFRPVNAVAVAPEEKKRIEKNPFFEKTPNKSVERRNASARSSHPLLWFLTATVLLGVGFAVANYFSSATVEITPFARNATIDQDFTVAKEGGEGELIFRFMSLAEEKTKEIPATVEKKNQKKASGNVLIFNAYNGEKQRLIKNTRLESADHKIFRIDESVVVPGAKMAGGKVVEPGSVLAIVYADVSGKEYNIGLADFTIPGFKGDPRYAKFTARSKADSPIGGGFSGTVKFPTDEAVLAVQEELKQDLKKISVEKARAQIPDGVSFFPGSMILKFEEVPQEFTTENTAKVSMRATVSVFFFDTALLVKKLAETALPEYKGNLFSIPDMSALSFSFVDSVDNIVLSDLAKIRFHLAGNAVFVGNVDERKIRAALVGKDKKDFGKIVVVEQNVGKAEAVIRPMWNTVFPGDPTKITVKIITK
ncbi:MAG: hypothetical protein HZB12_03300 [Candidatus Yonathbacteria bacterium]|nr:hypothetical protein [Candidatus Yonathbacteria bacterium]